LERIVEALNVAALEAPRETSPKLAIIDSEAKALKT
jgi:hypothetical protein